MMKPEITKNTSTPSQPYFPVDLKIPSLRMALVIVMWNQQTASAANPRKASTP
jgi:hypothetical protein